MIKNFYAIYDEAVGEYYTQFGIANVDAAKRVFAFSVNDPNSIVSNQPKDFSLWYVGTFDTETGIFSSTEKGKPVFVCEAMSLANQENK